MQPLHNPYPDPYFKERLSYTFRDKTFHFDTAALLFSPHAIDHGSALLLSTLIDKIGAPQSILELGCNYGVIGIVLAAFHPRAQVVLGDKDLLAVRYAAHNSALNNLANVSVIGSIGVEKIALRDVDLLVANIPTKIGDKAIEYDFIVRPLERLRAGGSYWLVADSQLNRLVPAVGRRHKLHVSEVNRRVGQIVYQIKKS